MRVKFGSRDSALAVIQSELIMNPIRNENPHMSIELVTMKTTGDRILDRTLDQIGGKGLFVKELDQALRDKRVDFTVHSLKDVPMEVPEDLPLVAFSRREDPRDCLVLPAGSKKLDLTKPIGCSSRRRQLQLKALYPKATIQPIRGNIQTRLDKLDRGEYGALVLAAAGLKRLGLEKRIHKYFSIEEMLPAAGQGTLVVQTMRGTDSCILRPILDMDTAWCSLAERSFVRALGGGCSAPVAAYAVVQDGLLTLTGLYVSPDETIVKKADIIGDPHQAADLGQILAEHLSNFP